MTSLFYCCLQKLKTVDLKTVKKSSKTLTRTLEIHFTFDIWAKNPPITTKTWPKVTKVDLKITKKWSIYDTKLFYGGHWGTPLTDPLKYMKKYTCQYVWISRWVALGIEKLSLNAFWLHKSCIKHHQNSSVRAEHSRICLLYTSPSPRD